MESNDLDPQADRPAGALTRMPTGAKVFVILVASLFPLALIALITTFQTARDADSETRARLQALARESSGVVEDVLANHSSQLSQALDALEADPRNAPACTRLAGTFASTGQVRFEIVDRGGNVLCGQRIPVRPETPLRPAQVSAMIVRDGLLIRIGGNAGASARAFYPAALLGALARPAGFVPEYGAELNDGDEALVLRELGGTGLLNRRSTVATDLSIDHLRLELSMSGAPITSPLILATVLLVLMWIAAAAIGWFVVDRLLIRPLRRLRRSVSNYQPGDVIDMNRIGAIPAEEIRELGRTFQQITRTVQAHEADLAEGLVRQTRLTREVHHRVKNNLQVIASLINFHARGAKSAEATEAYASIQRRVDALAVVHRHHYAEMEDNRGLELRSVIGELAANIRATAPDHAARLGITLEIEPLLANQDVAIAVAFLLTEIVELAMSRNPGAQVRIAIKGDPEDETRAIIRVVSPALVESPELEALLETRYGRVLTGLARQLRTRLHHDPLVGAYETSITITGRP